MFVLERVYVVQYNIFFILLLLLLLLLLLYIYIYSFDFLRQIEL